MLANIALQGKHTDGGNSSHQPILVQFGSPLFLVTWRRVTVLNVSLLAGRRVWVSPVSVADETEFITLARESASLHQGLIFTPTTPTAFREYLARFDGPAAIGFVVRLSATGKLAGFVNLYQITRTPGSRVATLGYGGFTATAGHGYVTEAVRLVVGYAFDELGLDRLEADVQPQNTASRRVVERTGFRPAGPVFKPICVAGEWRDHQSWVITSDISTQRGRKAPKN